MSTTRPPSATTTQRLPPGTVEAPDRAWWRRPDGAPRPGTRVPFEISSQYVTVRDGTRLAVDVYLPPGLPSGSRLPTICISTRYHRRRRPRWRWLGGLMTRFRLVPREIEAQRYLGAGYALVSWDARGSGASFGSRFGEPGDDEITDMGDVCDWIVAQSWSDGTVGATGVSYEGSTAEMMLRCHHPAFGGSVIRFSNWDPIPDVVLVGGVRQSWFLEQWSDHNTYLDRDRAEEFYRRFPGPIGFLSRLTAGVARVDEDRDDRLIRQAIAEHERNVMASDLTAGMVFRDDIDLERAAALAPHVDLTEIDPDLDVSPAGNAERLAGGGIAYSYCGWYDSAYGWATVKRFKALEHAGARLIMGPWDHGGARNVDPTSAVKATAFDHYGEVIRFFDHVLKGVPGGIADEPPVHYYTCGAGWRSAVTWPPPEVQHTSFYLGEDGAIVTEPPSDEGGFDRYRVDPSHTSGLVNRWRSIMNLRQEHIEWPDRAEQDTKLLVYETAPLDTDLEITGHPVVDLFVRSTADDGTFHVYLEEVTPAGEVRYITEGTFRARHRAIGTNPPIWETLAPYHTFMREDDQPLRPGEVAELAFGMQPISYRVAAGSRIRVAIGGADADNFVMVPDQPPTIDVLRSAEYPSHVVLPVMPW